MHKKDYIGKLIEREELIYRILNKVSKVEPLQWTYQELEIGKAFCYAYKIDLSEEFSVTLGWDPSTGEGIPQYHLLLVNKGNEIVIQTEFVGHHPAEDLYQKISDAHSKIKNDKTDGLDKFI